MSAKIRVNLRESGGRYLRSEVDELVQKAADQVEQIAKRLVPIDTGELRSDIHQEEEPDSEGLSILIGSDLEYAGYVENGTSRMAAQPYMRPALYQARVI